MSFKDVAIVFDCGATNIRVVAINIAGEIIASKSFSPVRSSTLLITL